MTPLLDVNGVGLDERLQPSSFRLPHPQLVALVGPNGSGKTSLLRALAGIEKTSGSVALQGKPLPLTSPSRLRSLMAFLPASRDVSWPIRVRDVITLGLDLPDPERVDELIGLLELGALADKPISQLSTGERARALLGRALASRPKLLLLDEPLSNLDPYWVLQTLEVLGDIVAEGAAVLLSLHDLSLLPRFDRVLLMDQGRLVAQGTPAELNSNLAFEQAFRVRFEEAGWAIAR